MTPRALHPAAVFDLLLGHWYLERTIPGQATMHGEATITPLTSSPAPAATEPHHVALYREQVAIQTATGHHLTGTAHYRFTRNADSTIDVHLHTGTLFHTLHFTPTPAGHLQAHATHPCADDRYLSTYRLLTPDHLTIEHHVTGPRKHHTISTTLTRRP